MSILIPGTEQGVYQEPETPMTYNQELEAWEKTSGYEFDADAQAWEEVWGQKVSAYVYGAALETVTIKKYGIIVATVETNASGVSDEQIALLYGTYTLTGSVSGYTREQTVDGNTDKFSAMPNGLVMYWYGNFSDSGGYHTEKAHGYNHCSHYITTGNYLSVDTNVESYGALVSNNSVDMSKYQTMHCHVKEMVSKFSGSKGHGMFAGTTDGTFSEVGDNSRKVYCAVSSGNDQVSILDTYKSVDITNQTSLQYATVYSWASVNGINITNHIDAIWFK